MLHSRVSLGSTMQKMPRRGGAGCSYKRSETSVLDAEQQENALVRADLLQLAASVGKGRNKER